MFESDTICPYPGLRPFTEEESLYFKGRDSHIDEVTELLQQNRFLMITGASGDGKSSLVFAGLVPNARAGFFKSKFNRWEIAHFRPERTPVRNFARALNPIIENASEDTIFTELNRGFGSLVDLYKSAPLYLDENAENFTALSKEEQLQQKREAANLLIIVDQFEEFFTNPENFHKGSPSQSAQVLVNLLLETARISIDQKLPIYVVFTMRSDYIGQCSAFRGLAEFIGFSQFFVPRLKRKDFQQIIEDPAVLNGNRITRRLVERLLFDMSEGVDQLPILQHTLNQIWLIADQGQEEMDLLHYARAGGMSAEELPEEDLENFENWFEKLPDWRIKHFRNPGLDLVLDLHADDLYEGSWEYYNRQHHEKSITRKDAKNIIAMTFACLTKIDDSRAVRNQMTLEEIVAIINKPHIDCEVAGTVINQFREQGNTLIRPFIDPGNEGSNQLHSDTVLDITHESLIRNWKRLTVWADKEFEYYQVYLDFQKQVDKWTQNNRNSGYLLPVGSLAFFENWYEECSPNPHWLNRYNDNSENKEANLAQSRKHLEEGVQFLKKSASKHIVSRTFMKYGTSQVAMVLAVIAVLFLSSFYFYDAERKRNDAVVVEIMDRTAQLVKSEQVVPWAKGYYLLTLDRLEKGKSIETISQIQPAKDRLEAAVIYYIQTFQFDNHFDPPEKGDILRSFAEVLKTTEVDNEDRLNTLNYFVDALGYDYYLNRRDDILELQQQLIPVLYNLITEIISSGKLDEVIDLNRGIENLVNWTDAPEHRASILNLLDPFEQDSRKTFDTFYPSVISIQNGPIGNLSISHKGGYQETAYLFAANGDLRRVKQCTDTLVKYNSSYMDFRNVNNGSNILGYLVQFGHLEKAKQYLRYLSEVTGISQSEIMNETLDRSGHLKTFYWDYRMDRSDKFYNPGLSVIDEKSLKTLFDLYESSIRKDYSGEKLDYRLALYCKQRGVFLHAYKAMRQLPEDRIAVYALFDNYVSHYARLSENFLDQRENIRYSYWTNGVRNRSFSRRYLLDYPDHFYNEWHTARFVSTVFMEYILEKHRIESRYSSLESLESINDWISNYYEYDPFDNEVRNLTSLPAELLENLLNKIGEADPNDFDFTFLHLLLANYKFSEGRVEEAMYHYEYLHPASLSTLANRWEYLNYTFIYNELLRLTKNLAEEGFAEQVYEQVEALPDNNYRALFYCMIADEIYRSNDKPQGLIYLDSALSKSESIESSQNDFNEYQFRLIQTLGGIGGEDLTEIARNMFIEMPPGMKSNGLRNYISGISYSGNFYRAMEAIPEDIPELAQFWHFLDILEEEALRVGPREDWADLTAELEVLRKDYIFFRNNN